MSINEDEYVPSVSFGSRPRKAKISSRPVNVPAIVPSPGTTHVASRAKTSRSAMPRFRANASKMRRTSASFSARPIPRLPARLPAVDHALDMAPLRVAEVEERDQPPRLCGVVVDDGRLEVLACRGGLAELPPQPAEQTDRLLIDRLCHRRAA